MTRTLEQIRAAVRRHAEAAPAGPFGLRLFVTGLTPTSSKTIARVRAACDEFLPGRYELEVIDLYQQPELARAEQVVAAPTLIRKQPLPLRRIVGNMSDVERLLAGLELLPQR